MADSPRYIASLTPLRGIAALMVLFFHIELVLTRSGFAPIVSPGRTHFFERGYLWVDFFFILSGFIIAHVYGDHLREGGRTREYLVARFSRLYPLHAFCLLTHVALFLWLSAVFPGRSEELGERLYRWDQLPLQVALLHSSFTTHQGWNDASWSIAAEWWAYVVAIFTIPLIHGRGPARAWLALFVGLAGVFGLITLHPGEGLHITHDFGFLRCLFEFTMGAGLYQLFRPGDPILRRDSAFVVAVALVILALHFDVHDAIAVPTLALLVVTAASNEGTARRVLSLRPLRFLGDVSYSFYMMQMFWFVLFAAGLELQKQGPGVEVGLGQQMSWVAIMFWLVLLSSWASYRWVEIPARRWVRRWLGGRQKAS